jgi:hypothetical protein
MLIVDMSGIPEVPNLFKVLLDEQVAESPGKPVIQGAVMTQLLVYLLRELAKQSESSLAWLNLLPVSEVAGVQAADRLFRRRPAVAASAVTEDWVPLTGSGLRPG